MVYGFRTLTLLPMILVSVSASTPATICNPASIGALICQVQGEPCYQADGAGNFFCATGICTEAMCTALFSKVKNVGKNEYCYNKACSTSACCEDARECNVADKGGLCGKAGQGCTQPLVDGIYTFNNWRCTITLDQCETMCAAAGLPVVTITIDASGNVNPTAEHAICDQRVCGLGDCCDVENDCELPEVSRICTSVGQRCADTKDKAVDGIWQCSLTEDQCRGMCLQAGLPTRAPTNAADRTFACDNRACSLGDCCQAFTDCDITERVEVCRKAGQECEDTDFDVPSFTQVTGVWHCKATLAQCDAMCQTAGLPTVGAADCVSRACTLGDCCFAAEDCQITER
eukprot:Rhum_TRINITY_DN15100_c1_g58::Rhum_TRINITY_DN15100_c1_g58_i4::g.141612::m.141612